MYNSPMTTPSCDFGVFFADFFKLLLNFILQVSISKEQFHMFKFLATLLITYTNT